MSSNQGFWRTLDEYDGNAAFEARLHDEFAPGAVEPVAAAASDGIDRRGFLKLVGASVALAGSAGCFEEKPLEKIVPYVDAPERVVPGKPLFFATAHVHEGFGLGIIVESHMGRPTKVEGNPRHPGSLGATDTFAQSSVLMLYDPDRSKVLLNRGVVSSWGAFLHGLHQALDTQNSSGGRGLRIVTGPITSPTLLALMRRVFEKYPQARWCIHDPVERTNVYDGAALAFGRALSPIYDFSRADVIVALDSDCLFSEPGWVRHARQFVDARRIWRQYSTSQPGSTQPAAQMNRLYAVDPTPTITGSMADHRLPLRSQRVMDMTVAIAAALGVALRPNLEPQLSPDEQKWAGAVADDLREHRGRGLVLAGRWQPAAVHALAHAINSSLGNSAVSFIEPLDRPTDLPVQSLKELTADLSSGAAQVLLIAGSNPAYTGPADLDFAQALLTFSRADKAPALSAHLGLYPDATANLCQWHVPESHPLESWGDVRAVNGLVSVIQPLIAPLYESRSACELLAAVLGDTSGEPYGAVREHWRGSRDDETFEDEWSAWLRQGFIPGTQAAVQNVSLSASIRWPQTPAQSQPATAPSAAPPLELVFRPDPTIWDGRYTTVGWQQELPKPFTKLMWDNAVMLGRELANQLGLKNGEVVKLTHGGRSLEGPVWVLPGQASGVITIHLGYGHALSSNALARGFNAYVLRTSAGLWHASGVSIEKTGRTYDLAVNSFFHTMNERALDDMIQPETVANAGDGEPGPHNRRLVRTAGLEEFRRNPHFVDALEAEASKAPLLSLYPEYKYDGYKWAMAIDLTACIGCGACVVACQAENNIPVVGKSEAARGRDMHWIRIDDYFKGEPDNPEVYHQPLPCMHCENAPCELVCPVNATVHDHEGLNEMIYNRCVGTRYCSNNCPYKVRRFNYFRFSDFETATIKMQKNPNVTVRGRGVMEKCTYCIQRIAAGRIEAEKQDRRIHDGEVVPACAQVCPTRAIVFGDLNDPDSQVNRLKTSPLNYGLLTELTTQPRTTYLARIRNPNPALEEHKA